VTSDRGPAKANSQDLKLPTLLPILAAAGIEPKEPMVARVHNEIKG
jgi:hypothetical protein